MTQAIADPESFVARLERVERENKRLRFMGSVAVLAMAGVLCVGMTVSPAKRLEGDMVVVKDSQGKSRIVLAVGEDGPALTLLDRNGKLRVNLEVTQEGPALDLLDASEHPRAQLMVTEDQGPILNFYDSKGAQVTLKP